MHITSTHQRKRKQMAKIVRFHQIGGPDVLKIEEGPSWEPGKGEAKLRVQAIGLNRAESMFMHICRGLATVALSLWLAGCNKQQPVAHGPPAPEVTVSKPEQKEVVNWNELTGRTAAVKLVNVTPRVSGYIVDIPFKEGDIVHKGDLLFQIDPRPYQDALRTGGWTVAAGASQSATAGCYL